MHFVLLFHKGYGYFFLVITKSSFKFCESYLNYVKRRVGII